MKKIIITKGEETQIVESLEGYDGWKVVGEHSGDLPEAARWDRTVRKVRECGKTVKAHERRARARNTEHLLDRIEALEALVAALKDELAEVSKRIASL